MPYFGVDFVIHYDELLKELKERMDPEYHEVIFRYRYADPHELVAPDDYFETWNDMIKILGFMIWVDEIQDVAPKN